MWDEQEWDVQQIGFVTGYNPKYYTPKGASFYVDYISSGMDTFIRYVGSDFCTSGGTFLYVERDPPVMIPTLDSSILYVGSYDRSK
jgi:hypothetical protein